MAPENLKRAMAGLLVLTGVLHLIVALTGNVGDLKFGLTLFGIAYFLLGLFVYPGKATAVRVVPGTDPAAGAGATGLTGQALRLSRGSQRDEVTLTLAGGQQLVGFADRPNRLRTGSRVTAWLDDTAVVLALSG